jgi:hypothetical protein
VTLKGVETRIHGLGLTLELRQFLHFQPRSCTMSHTATSSKTFPAGRFTLDEGVRELIAAMPIVILFKAVRAAFKR